MPDNANHPLSIDITKELQKTFDKAIMQHEAKSLTQGQDWKQARTIIERGEKERAAIERKYRNEYDTRVEIVRKRLSKEAGECKLNHPTPKGRDKFDRQAINRQAHREVKLDHKRVLQQSLDKQNHKLQALQDKARKRDQKKQLSKSTCKARDQFAQVSDRRAAPDRRAPTRSR